MMPYCRRYLHETVAALAAIVAIGSVAVAGLDNGLDRTPFLGFNTWEGVGCNVTEKYVMDAADAMVTTGLLDAGYDVLSIDDCWVDAKRNASGFLQPSRDFADVSAISRSSGSSMRALSDYVHSRGLKFGLYQSAGTMTCQQRAGSLGYEWIDAQTFADWKIDLLKYDDCFHEGFSQVEKDSARRFPFDGPPILRYPLMAMALNKTGRNISYYCNFPWQLWGSRNDAAMGGAWVAEFCNSWRTCGDPSPGFDNAMSYVDCAEQWANVVPSGPGAFNNLAAIEIGNGAMTLPQAQAAFSLYALVRTPILIGGDVLSLSSQALSVYLNKEIIDTVVKDPLGKPGRRIREATSPLGELWSGQLAGTNRFIVALVNRDAQARNATLRFTPEDLPGLSLTGGTPRDVRDVWKHASKEPMPNPGDEQMTVQLNATSAAVYVLQF